MFLNLKNYIYEPTYRFSYLGLVVYDLGVVGTQSKVLRNQLQGEYSKYYRITAKIFLTKLF